MEKEKRKNRKTSYAFGIIFLCSLAIISIFSFKLIQSYLKNKNLQDSMNQVIHQHEPSPDGYYTVYVDDYSIAFDGGRVIISFPNGK